MIPGPDIVGICPHCDGELDRTALNREAEPGEMALAPYICGWCASVMLLDLKDHRLFVLSPEILEAARGTPGLAEIERLRALVLSAPNRRPVLR